MAEDADNKRTQICSASEYVFRHLKEVSEVQYKKDQNGREKQTLPNTLRLKMIHDNRIDMSH